MAIFIVDEKPDIHLTLDQFNRLLDEYQRAHLVYSGAPPTFEQWVRQSQGHVTELNPRLRN